MTNKLAELGFFFDYSLDTDFKMPNWPFFPDRAQPYDFRNITKECLVDGFSKVVGKHWGRVLFGLDPSQNGAFRFQGNSLWGDIRMVVTGGDVLDERYVYSGTSGGAGSFGLLTQMTVEYHDQNDTLRRDRPLMLAGNITDVRFGIVLLPKKSLKELATVHGIDLQHWFGTSYMQNVTMHIGEVQMPFPFHATKVEFKDYRVFNKAVVGVKLNVAEDYVVSHIMIGRGNGNVNVDVPLNVNGEAPLLFGWDAVTYNMSPYGYLAEILQSGFKEGIIQFNSLMGDGQDLAAVESVKRNRSMMLKSFSGTGVEKGEKFEGVKLGSIPVPDGLSALPELPLGYVYITDLSGIVYVTDQKMKGVLFPYQVFDLPGMRSLLEGLRKKAEMQLRKGGEVDGDLEQMMEIQERQIQLVEELFTHQENVLKGNQFNYSMMRGNYGNL